MTRSIWTLALTLIFASAISLGANTALAETQGTILQDAESLPLLAEKDGKRSQFIKVSLEHTGDPAKVEVSVTGGGRVDLDLKAGEQSVEVEVPAVDKETSTSVEVKVAGKTVASREVVLRPVRKWEVYLMPHSHNDIGYTKVQTEVESDQWRFFEEAIEASKRTADYPPGSQFKWNSEVVWAVDGYLKQATPDKKAAFVEAVRKGWVEINALYGNELTGLCRPEELARLVDRACRLRKEYGFSIDTAMISDVPGYTWGIVPVFAKSGVKYFSVGPNGGDRIGLTLEEWADRPFYWISPSGDSKVLVWVHGQGYSWFHRGKLRDGDRVLEYLSRLESEHFPYDIVGLRYNIGGDNGPPDVDLGDFIKDWNSRYVYPKIIIATASEMFHEFEKRYADSIPACSGDFTPYWEDGAASTALETAANRAAAERLAQAETLWTMIDPAHYPDDRFVEAWRNVILYDEHTWGAHNSISEPDSDFAKDQWKIKQAFAFDAEKQSQELLSAALEKFGAPSGKADSVLVINTCSWPRTDLVILPSDKYASGDQVIDSGESPVLSQRLSNGDLAFLAEEIPALGAKRFHIKPGKASIDGHASATSAALATTRLAVAIDQKTGAITSVKDTNLPEDLVNAVSGMGLNEYFYVPGKDPADAQRSGAAKISVLESGPLVASLRVESSAPGCRNLTREVRVIDGINRVDITNIVDKEKVREKEGVHFAFPFNVPEGVVRMDIPWAVARPEADQLPGSCKNWFTVQRWVDVSNQDYGVTWATVDAPMVEVGAINAETPWMKTIAPSQTLYSYVMNNYWHTNYKADQEGPTVFRYALQPHQRFLPSAAARFGIEQSQPLIAKAVKADTAEPVPCLHVEPAGVILTALKPVNQGKTWIVRLFGASGSTEKASISLEGATPPKVWMSDLTEVQGAPVTGPVEVPPYGMVTLRVEAAPR
jgi:hypothetical protein